MNGRGRLSLASLHDGTGCSRSVPYTAPVVQPKARSLIFTVLGDLRRIGAHEIRLKALVELGELLGVSALNMRVLLPRMRDEGWFDVRREGRESIYALTERSFRTIAEGRQRIFRGEVETWNGSWSLVIYTVPEHDRMTRERLRRRLAWMGFGPLTPATWVSPNALLERVAALGASMPNASLELLTMQSSGLAADRAIATRCWDLEALNHDYDQFIRDLRMRLPTVRATELRGSKAFGERIMLVHRFRELAYRDPNLPVELQPAGWLGDQARTIFTEAHELLAIGADDFYRQVLGEVDAG